MAAAIDHCGWFPVRVEPQHNLLAEKRERFGSVRQLIHWDHRIPEPAEYLLPRDEHRRSPFFGRVDVSDDHLSPEA
jgi:hypothetical protein